MEYSTYCANYGKLTKKERAIWQKRYNKDKQKEYLDQERDRINAKADELKKSIRITKKEIK